MSTAALPVQEEQDAALPIRRPPVTNASRPLTAARDRAADQGISMHMMQHASLPPHLDAYGRYLPGGDRSHARRPICTYLSIVAQDTHPSTIGGAGAG